jgi:capsid assembly protease
MNQIELIPTERGRSAMVALDHATIIRHAAGPVVALHPGFIGRMVALSPAKSVVRSATAGIVSIRGPLAQRAIADMCGYVDGYDAIVSRFQAAHSDTETDVVILDIDSPGGDVAGLEQAVEKMRETTARSGKPVYVFVNEGAFSAAYWIAALVATPGGMSLPPAGSVGSIGCIGGLVDESGALEQAGIVVTLVRSPAGKAESHSADPIMPLAQERLQKRVDAVADRFCEAVAKARGLKSADVAAFNADTFDGQAAVKVGLADKVEDFESLVARAQTAGRKWRRSTEKAMDIEKRLADLEAFQAKAFGIFGVKTEAEYFGAATAAKEIAAAAPEKEGLLAAATENLAALSKRADDNEAEQAIKVAQDERKVVPGNLEKAKSHYAEFGLKSLKSYLNGLVPVAPAAERQATEPKTVVATPAQIAPGAAAGASPEAGTARFEDMTPMQKHAVYRDQGAAAYDAIKADWVRRGSPKSAAQFATPILAFSDV